MYACMHTAGEYIHDVDYDLRGICIYVVYHKRHDDQYTSATVYLLKCI